MTRSVSVRRFIWEQRLRSLLYVLLAVLIVGGLLAAVALYSVGSTSEQSGLVTEVLRESSEQGQIRTSLLVELDSGQTVKAHLPTGVQPRQGQRVTLTQTETLLFGARRYHFKSYPPPTDTPTQNP